MSNLRWVTGVATHRSLRFVTSQPLSPVKDGNVVPRLKLYVQDFGGLPEPQWRCDSVEQDYIVTGFGRTAKLAWLNWAIANRLKTYKAFNY